MTTRDNGGPAFPAEVSPDAETVKILRETTGIGIYEARNLLSKHGGMSLRDWFAAAALPAIINATSVGQHHPGAMRGLPAGATIEARICADAYALADTMLVERAR